MVIAITRSGYVKRLPVTTYREQRRGGIGVMGMELKDEDYIEHLVVASTHDYLLFFTSVGKIYRLKVHELPLGSRQSKGRALVNLLPLAQGESVRTLIATRDFGEAEYLVLATKNGVVKKTRFAEYNTPLKADGIIAIKLRDKDELVAVLHSSGEDDILMVSRKGQAIRFHESAARPMGRATEGVRGMSLRKGDEVIAASLAENDADLLVVTRNGFGKRTPIRDYPVKGRGGLGVQTVKLTEARGELAGALVVRDGYPDHAHVHGRHRDQGPGRGREAARPLDAGRHRHAACATARRSRPSRRSSTRPTCRKRAKRRLQRVTPRFPRSPPRCPAEAVAEPGADE